MYTRLIIVSLILATITIITLSAQPSPANFYPNEIWFNGTPEQVKMFHTRVCHNTIPDLRCVDMDALLDFLDKSGYIPVK